MKIVYLLIPFLFTLLAFKQKPGVKLSFKNNTAYEFKELTVNIRGKEYSFANLKPGKATKPIIVAGTYRYCYARAITATDTLICQPSDFVGEKLYTSGKLQMKLELLPNSDARKYLIIK